MDDLVIRYEMTGVWTICVNIKKSQQKYIFEENTIQPDLGKSTWHGESMSDFYFERYWFIADWYWDQHAQQKVKGSVTIIEIFFIFEDAKDDLKGSHPT